MEEAIKIYVIEMLTFEVRTNEFFNRNFIGKKAILAERNKESAEQTIENFRKSENENREKFKDLYHLEYDYMIQEIKLY